MHLNCGRVLALATVLIPVLPLRGQSAPPAAQPYTAEFKITTTRTLADGTLVTKTDKEIFVRDSQGRTREQWTRFSPPDVPAVTTVFINDDIDLARIQWDSTSNAATIIKLPSPADEAKGCWTDDAGSFHIISHNYPPPAPQQFRPNGKTPDSPGTQFRPYPDPNLEHDDLGTQTIMGVVARGTRTTRTTPVGEAGNDRPLVEIVESWSASDLGINIRESRDDQRGNKSEMELVRLDLDEPDPSKFQPPPDKELHTSAMHQYPCPEKSINRQPTRVN